MKVGSNSSPYHQRSKSTGDIKSSDFETQTSRSTLPTNNANPQGKNIGARQAAQGSPQQAKSSAKSQAPTARELAHASALRLAATIRAMKVHHLNGPELVNKKTREALYARVLEAIAEDSPEGLHEMATALGEMIGTDVLCKEFKAAIKQHRKTRAIPDPKVQGLLNGMLAGTRKQAESKRVTGLNEVQLGAFLKFTRLLQPEQKQQKLGASAEAAFQSLALHIASQDRAGELVERAVNENVRDWAKPLARAAMTDQIKRVVAARSAPRPPVDAKDSKASAQPQAQSQTSNTQSSSSSSSSSTSKPESKSDSLASPQPSATTTQAQSPASPTRPAPSPPKTPQQIGDLVSTRTVRTATERQRCYEGVVAWLAARKTGNVRAEDMSPVVSALAAKVGGPRLRGEFCSWLIGEYAHGRISQPDFRGMLDATFAALYPGKNMGTSDGRKLVKVLCRQVYETTYISENEPKRGIGYAAAIKDAIQLLGVFVRGQEAALRASNERRIKEFLGSSEVPLSRHEQFIEAFETPAPSQPAQQPENDLSAALFELPPDAPRENKGESKAPEVGRSPPRQQVLAMDDNGRPIVMGKRSLLDDLEDN